MKKQDHDISLQDSRQTNHQNHRDKPLKTITIFDKLPGQIIQNHQDS